MADSDQKVVQALIDARAALAVKKAFHSHLAGNHFAMMSIIEEDDKRLVEMLTRYGHKLDPLPINGKAKATTEIGGLLGVISKLGEPPKAEERKFTADEVATEWIVRYGAVDAAMHWCEWMITHRIIPDPSPVPTFYDNFPQTLKAQYNDDRGRAIEALRAQLVSWSEKPGSKLRYADAKVTAKTTTSLTEASATYLTAADLLKKKETV